MATPQKKNRKYSQRTPEPHNQMKSAVKNRCVEDLIWSLVALSANELKRDKAFVTLSANHLVSLIDQLIKLEKQKPEGDPVGLEEEVNDWLHLHKA